LLPVTRQHDGMALRRYFKAGFNGRAGAIGMRGGTVEGDLALRSGDGELSRGSRAWSGRLSGGLDPIPSGGDVCRAEGKGELVAANFPGGEGAEGGEGTLSFWQGGGGSLGLTVSIARSSLGSPGWSGTVSMTSGWDVSSGMGLSVWRAAVASASGRSFGLASFAHFFFFFLASAVVAAGPLRTAMQAAVEVLVTASFWEVRRDILRGGSGRIFVRGRGELFSLGAIEGWSVAFSFWGGGRHVGWVSEWHALSVAFRDGRPRRRWA